MRQESSDDAAESAATDVLVFRFQGGNGCDRDDQRVSDLVPGLFISISAAHLPGDRRRRCSLAAWALGKGFEGKEGVRDEEIKTRKLTWRGMEKEQSSGQKRPRCATWRRPLVVERNADQESSLTPDAFHVNQSRFAATLHEDS